MIPQNQEKARIRISPFASPPTTRSPGSILLDFIQPFEQKKPLFRLEICVYQTGNSVKDVAIPGSGAVRKIA
jgi:hypothetical protein